MPSHGDLAPRITCNACISACERGSQWQLALELLGQLQRQALRSTAGSYVAVAAASLSVGGWGVWENTYGIYGL